MFFAEMMCYGIVGVVIYHLLSYVNVDFSVGPFVNLSSDWVSQGVDTKAVMKMSRRPEGLSWASR